MNRKIIAVVGPTASGKTGIGVKLARDFNGEIVSADSRQIYRGLDLGTGKDLVEYGEIKYHLIDICSPRLRKDGASQTDFSVFDWVKLAREAIEDIFSRGKTPIVVGGTGLYIQALIEGFELESQKSKVPASPAGRKSQKSGGLSEAGSHFSREQLEGLTREELQQILKKLDSETYQGVDLNNPHRLIRAIERAQSGLKPVKIKPDFEVLQIGVTWPREVLHRRIDQRVEERFDEGMLSEICELLNSGVDHNWMIKLGLEYRIITSFIISNFQFSIFKEISNSEIKKLKNTNEFELMKQELKWKIHQFARRQETWFRRFSEIVWENDYDTIKKLASKFLG